MGALSAVGGVPAGAVAGLGQPGAGTGGLVARGAGWATLKGKSLWKKGDTFCAVMLEACDEGTVMMPCGGLIGHTWYK